MASSQGYHWILNKKRLCNNFIANSIKREPGRQTSVRLYLYPVWERLSLLNRPDQSHQPPYWSPNYHPEHISLKSLKADNAHYGLEGKQTTYQLSNKYILYRLGRKLRSRLN